MIASTVLVLTAGRLSDLFGRKRAYVGGFVLFALASLGAGFADGGTAADPVADPAGRRRRVPVRQLGRARDGRVPARAARPRDGDEHDGRRDRPRARPGARRRAGRRSPGSGCSGSTSRSALVGAAWGGARAARARARPTTVRGLDLAGTRHFVVGLTGLVLAVSTGGHLRLGRPGRHRRPDRRRGPAAGCSC